MPRLFSYGMLQQEQVQRSLFGRTLDGRKDRLCGFERTTMRIADPNFAHSSGKAEHPILRPTGRVDDTVEGFVFELTDDELRHADRFEPVEYRRVAVDLASGARAWVYIDAKFTGQEKEAD